MDFFKINCAPFKRWLKEIGSWLWRYRNYLIIYVTPFLILPLPLMYPSSEANCGYVIILMALYWCTECIPLAVTALLPVILFPFLGIMRSEKVCVLYLKDSNMLFIGGLVVAIAVEQWNLHKRIALSVLLIVGVRPALLMLGFMSVTAFLSMWISNTATTAMMLPIAQAVLEQLSKTEAERDDRELKEGRDNQAFEMAEVTTSKISYETENQYEISVPEHTVDPVAEQKRKAREQKYLWLNKGMSLSVCYSASIGGTATLTGTTPNLILKGQMDSLYQDNPNVINFASWFGFAFPNMVLMLLLAWLWLQCMYLGLNFKKTFGCGLKNDDQEANNVMKQEYKKLGRMKFGEGAVLAIFVVLVVMWFSREPGFMPGWASSFNQSEEYVTDGTVAILISTLFFLIPSQIPLRFCGSKQEEHEGTGEGDNTVQLRQKKSKAPSTLLNWAAVHERMPWNIVLLLGGGYALASGSEVSGLSDWLGKNLAPLQSIPPFAISILLCLLVGMFTECSSNTATTTLFLPILASMASTIKLHPLYVMLPCTISASMAFMLPVATPPNAIAFSYGTLKVLDMAKAGFVLNLIGILCINLAINTWGTLMFKLDTFPLWANATSKAP
ncbi:solute carrier family 13 member 2 isoform X1 [Ictalurus punctatus]|uniref:Solute carrier family 13 member 2 isoform X1 n=2 Tax=Ictalurus punctatus TaxID=7998 RepID=A0A2D0T0Z9_ICTPU|nr:solute carrier family 13 member 2 isoform X1 [Ictalurus punctatus]